MQMNEFRSRPRVRERGWLPRTAWLFAPLVAAALVVGIFFLLRPPPAERALRVGRQRLLDGDSRRAAAAFERAIELAPDLEAAWRGLLMADPSPSVCRRFAQHWPEVFDFRQPVQDPTLLVRGRGWNEALWRRSLELYETAVLALPADAGDENADVLRLDVLGRKEIAEAWEEVRKLKAELQTDLRNPLQPGRLRPFSVYDLPGVQKFIAEAVGDFEDPNRWLEQLARLDAAVKNHNTGLARLTEVVEREPAFVPAQLTLAYTEIARGDPAAAEQRCRQLLEARSGAFARPAEVRIRYCLAKALQLNGDHEAAVGEIRRILALEPASTEARVRLGTLYLKLGRLDEADAIADELMKDRVRDRGASYIKGVASLRRGQYEMASAQLGAALRGIEPDPATQYYLARARWGAGKPFLAFQEFTRAAVRAADPSWPMAAASACALAAGSAKDAAAAAEELLADEVLLKAHPKLLDYALRFTVAADALRGGQVLADVSTDELGRRAADRELANYLIAGVWAGRAHAVTGSAAGLSEEQLAFFKAAAAKEPSAQYCLAFLQAARGQVSEARETLEKLIDAKPDFLLAALHLARLYLIEGKTERAARVIERTGRARTSVLAARTLASIEALQGVAALRDPHSTVQDTGERDLPGPHLAFFAITVHADPDAYARRILLLDPTSGPARDVLALTYAQVRTHGIEGVGLAAKADGRVKAAMRRSLAVHQASGRRLYRLVIGRFWQDLPPHL